MHESKCVECICGSNPSHRGSAYQSECPAVVGSFPHGAATALHLELCTRAAQCSNVLHGIRTGRSQCPRMARQTWQPLLARCQGAPTRCMIPSISTTKSRFLADWVAGMESPGLGTQFLQGNPPVAEPRGVDWGIPSEGLARNQTGGSWMCPGRAPPQQIRRCSCDCVGGCNADKPITVRYATPCRLGASCGRLIMS